MADYQTDRAAFVENEYRYGTISKPEVKARNSAARDVTIDTQLDQASAKKIAQAVIDVNENPRVFEIEIEGVIHPSDLVGGVPSYILNSIRDATDDRPMTLIKVSSNEDTNISVLTVRG